jgi:hypothetical protein
MYPMSRLRAGEDEIVLAQQRRSKMPLPEVPGIGTSYYADLRAATAVDQKFLTLDRRVAQLSKDGCRRLQAQIFGFFTGLDATKLP